ncbi:MAG: thiol-activated cytolysin family protein [Saprospiraceae bacterium]|nr:thiol-activated cytolysin family protein [Saprospiraceae bacterium]
MNISRTLPLSSIRHTMSTRANLRPLTQSKYTKRIGTLTRTVLPDDGISEQISRTDGESINDREDNVICTVTPMFLEAGFNEANILNPDGVEFWPGRLIDISSIDDGSYTNFTDFTSRNNISISLNAAGTSANNINETIQGTDITRGNVVNAINRIKRNWGPNNFGSLDIGSEEIRAYEINQFFLEAKAGVMIPGMALNISATASTSNIRTKNTIVYKLFRAAYTVGIDSDISTITNLNPEDVSEDGGIVSAVKYGSFALIEVTSELTHDSINALMSAAFSVGGTTIEAGLESRLNHMISSSSVKILLRGVSENFQTNAATIEDFKKVLFGIKEEFSATSPVVPIAFVIRSLKSGQIMKLKTTMTFNKRDCTIIPPDADISMTLQVIGIAVLEAEVESSLDIFGKINFDTDIPNTDYVTVWEKKRHQAVEIAEGVGARYDAKGSSKRFKIKFKASTNYLSTKSLIIGIHLKDRDGSVDDGFSHERFYLPLSSLYKPKSDRYSEPNYEHIGPGFAFTVQEANGTQKLVIYVDRVD